MQSQSDQGRVEMGGEPFSPQGPRPRWAGGSRRALIGCGALILLLGIGSMVFLLKAKDIFGWMMGELEAEIEESLPANITEQERTELSRAFDAAIETVQEDRVSPEGLRDLQGMFRDALGDEPKRLSREEVQELIEALDRVSGRSAGHGVDPPEAGLVEVPAVDASRLVTNPDQ